MVTVCTLRKETVSRDYRQLLVCQPAECFYFIGTTFFIFNFLKKVPTGVLFRQFELTYSFIYKEKLCMFIPHEYLVHLKML